MLSLKSLIFGKKSVPYIDVLSETTRDGINKAYIPKFLYRPPFGFPRYANMEYIRHLSRTPYVEACVDTILKEISAIEWDIVPNPEIPERIAEDIFYNEDGSFNDQTEFEKNHIRSFLMNPNTNPDETFEDVFIKMCYRDVLEVNAGVLVKTFNMRQNMVEVVARDGATFTRNPDVNGMFTNRDEILLAKDIRENQQEVTNAYMEISSMSARERAAFFQYGWIAGPMPVPFGKREIVWLANMKRTDDIYGYSPVQILAKSLQMLIYHIESDLEYFNNNNIPKGVIGVDASDTDDIKTFKEQWYDAQQTKDEMGNNRKLMHKVPILNYIPKFERIEFSSQEIQLIEKQKWYSKMVWAAFGITGTELGYTEDGQGVSNQIVQSKVFKKKAINPAVRAIENGINRGILPEFEYTIDADFGNQTFTMPKYVFKFNTFDIDEEKSKAELHKLWIDTGRKTINEIRIEEGEKPVDWGDDAPQGMSGGNNFFMGGGRDESSDFDDFDFEESEPMDSEDTQSRNVSRVNNSKSLKKKDFFLKHKYRSRKKVRGKWVYDYGDDKLDVSAKEDDDVIKDVVKDESFKDYVVGIVNDLRNKFKDFSFSAGSVEGFLKDFLMLKHNAVRGGGSRGVSGSRGASRGASRGVGDKKKSKLEKLFEKYGFENLSSEQKKALVGAGNEMYKDLVTSEGTKETSKDLGSALNDYLGDMSIQDLIDSRSFAKTRIDFIEKQGLSNDDDRAVKFTNAFIDAKGDEIKSRVKEMLTVFNYSTPESDIKKSRDTSYFLGSLSRGVKRGEQEQDVALKLFGVMNNDVVETNKALKYMGFKERVKKDGLRKQSVARSPSEVIKDMTKGEVNGVKYNLGANFIKNSMFKNEVEFKESVKNAVDRLPESSKKYINAGKTELNFVTKHEIKGLLKNSRLPSRAAGFYTPENNQIYIYPDKGNSGWKFKTSVYKEKLAEEGYDESMFTLAQKNAFEHTIVHELAHAVSLNPDETGKRASDGGIFGKIGKLQEDYNDFYYNMSQDRKFENVSRYAGTNTKEDFAETFAFYGLYKNEVDKVLDRGDKVSWLSQGVIERMKWMRENVW